MMTRFLPLGAAFGFLSATAAIQASFPPAAEPTSQFHGAIAQTTPGSINDPMVSQCYLNVKSQIQAEYAGVENTIWDSSSITQEFVSNAESRYRGSGQFLQDRIWYNFTFNCLVNIRQGTVVSATYQIQSPGSGNTSSPASQNDPLLRQCEAAVSSAIRQAYALERLIWSSDTEEEYFISNAQVGYRGQGSFLQDDNSWHGFSFDCGINTRTGQIENVNYFLL
ncbi:MAG: hypothetical protein EA368_01680 [Leptolyngbya sp. DLM2.Bin27]|nr:MAG: hypothetical protein EA368_01680 [Leptolyngbya sp. DLM2.Bin27]